MLHSIAMQYWVTYAGANAYDGWMTRNRLGIPEVQANITVRDRKSTRLNSSHLARSRMPSSA